MDLPRFEKSKACMSLLPEAFCFSRLGADQSRAGFRRASMTGRKNPAEEDSMTGEGRFLKNGEYLRYKRLGQVTRLGIVLVCLSRF